MPHLYELRPLPAEVGGVPIVWINSLGNEGKLQFARREKGKLLLPNDPENDFLPLGDAKLLFLNNEEGTRYYSGQRYSFCGMDESPFHAFVTDEAVDGYKNGGAEGFFEALVPKFIKYLRDRPDIPDGYRRQGDWFANRLPFSWEEIEQFMRLGRDKELGSENVKKQPLFGTRHHFTGRIAREVPIFGWKCTLVEGVISAPDHSDLVLSGGPHAVSQTANLADSEKAD